MMPPEGTFLHWFLTNKAIHMYIALVCAPLVQLPHLHRYLLTPADRAHSSH
jgi:hypothetical protein